METAVGRQALVDQWERTAAAFGQPVDDAGYARLEELGERGSVVYAVTAALVAGPVLTVGVADSAPGMSGGRASFQAGDGRHDVCGGHPGAAAGASRRHSGMSGNDIERHESWGRSFSSLEGTSPVARFLGALDVFVIWWAIVLAIGVSVLYRRRARHDGRWPSWVFMPRSPCCWRRMAVTGGSARNGR